MHQSQLQQSLPLYWLLEIKDFDKRQIMWWLTLHLRNNSSESAAEVSQNLQSYKIIWRINIFMKTKFDLWWQNPPLSKSAYFIQGHILYNGLINRYATAVAMNMRYERWTEMCWIHKRTSWFLDLRWLASPFSITERLLLTIRPLIL